MKARKRATLTSYLSSRKLETLAATVTSPAASNGSATAPPATAGARQQLSSFTPHTALVALQDGASPRAGLAASGLSAASLPASGTAPDAGPPGPASTGPFAAPPAAPPSAPAMAERREPSSIRPQPVASTSPEISTLTRAPEHPPNGERRPWIGTACDIGLAPLA